MCDILLTCRVGLNAQYPQIWVMNEAKMGSIDDSTVPENPLEMMNSVSVATMRTEASGFTSCNAVWKVDG